MKANIKVTRYSIFSFCKRNSSATEAEAQTFGAALPRYCRKDVLLSNMVWSKMSLLTAEDWTV